jgi:hypothetical protein
MATFTPHGASQRIKICCDNSHVVGSMGRLGFDNLCVEINYLKQVKASHLGYV